jgi:hypothetical protein
MRSDLILSPWLCLCRHERLLNYLILEEVLLVVYGRCLLLIAHRRLIDDLGVCEESVVRLRGVLEVRSTTHVDVREALRFLDRQIIYVVADDLLSQLTNLAWVIFLRFT